MVSNFSQWLLQFCEWHDTFKRGSLAADETEEYMQGFNRGTIVSTAVHEVYPGHYLQFLWLQNIPTKVRKLMGCSTNVEG